MTDAILSLAQFIYIIWPFIIIGALVYSFQGILVNEQGRRRRGGRLRYLGQNMRTNLLVTWTGLFLVWIITLFAPQPNLSIAPEPWNSIVFVGGYALLLAGQAYRLGWFTRRLNAHLDFHRTQAIQDLKDMDPYAFEALVTETYRALGYRVKHVGHSGDHGVDVEMYTASGEHWVVQCKRYHDSVGESIIRELFGTMTSERAARGVLVTTAEITLPARAWAQGKPITLIDGPALLDLIAEARERSEGSLFDRLAHAIDHLLHPRGLVPGLSQRKSVPSSQTTVHTPFTTQPTPSRNGYRSTPTAPAQLDRTQPVHAQARVYQAPDHSATAPLEIEQRTAYHNGNGKASTPAGATTAGTAATNSATTDPAATVSVATARAAAITAPAQGAYTHPHSDAPHTHAPTCPACGSPMVLRPPRPSDRPGRRYYRCSTYPNCRAVLEKE